MMTRRTLFGAAALGASALAATGFAAPAPSSEEELCYAPVSNLLALFRSRKLSPVELLQAQIRRIEQLNPKVNAITYKHYDEALSDARKSEQRYRRGDARPLDGITVGLKDEDDRAGWRTTMGSLIYKDAPPATENSAIVDALETAGAVIHIQTTVPEFYLSASASTRLWGTTRNPWNLYYSPGGSSSGSAAALAAGFTTLATGSDMAGSIRIPASQCGLYGFKPPFGRVATSEVSYETLGPLARTFDDLVHMQNAIAGPSVKVLSALRPKLDYPHRYLPLAGTRIAVDWGKGLGDLIPSVRAAMLEAIATARALGCAVEEVDCGFSRQQFGIMMRGLMSTGIGMLLLTAMQHRDLLSPYVAQWIDREGTNFGPADAAAADALAERLHRSVQEKVFVPGCLALLMPTMATPFVAADTLDSKEEVTAATGLKYAMTWPWNLLSRYPVVDAPLGLVEKHMPTGMQIVGNTFDDLTAFRFAAAWAQRRPPLFAGDRHPGFSSEA